MKIKTFFIAGLLLMSLASIAQNNTTKVLVYDFHMTNRCQTCTKIEQTTIEALDTFYRAQLDSGIVVFKSFDCEIDANADLVKKYSAYGSTLVLTAILADGKEVIVDITDMAFSKIGKKELFIEKLREKIDELLSLQ
ncbi:MAG: hypothetical protein CVU11_08130 [Bacteroidetes bacterium HGW-Bacteroidetes-6]|jgi:ABC-type thiamine transport system substrate-binding protein|nr:MAG: hypothetical protein CVU11_08130 [Bacteroidetes bacterium HGW-Bacteroidetes-6]